MVAQGRPQEAIAEAERARDLDPLSASANWHLGALLYRSRAYDRAIEQEHLALEMDPNFYPAHKWLEKAVAEERTGLLPAMKTDPIYDSTEAIRGSPDC